MAIQNRRGTFTYYDPTKLLPGEFAVVQSGDPSTTSGKALYMAFSAGTVLRIISYEELQAALNAFTFDWTDITNKPTPDTTLTESGNAADAAATGSAINNAVLNLAPAYSSSSTYAVGAYCVYQKTLYQCNTAISTAEAWNSSHWTQVKVMAATTSLINSAVNTIDGRIDGVEDDITDINTALATKATKTELTTAVNGLASDIQAEATARQSADSAINTELATKATTTALNAETTARQSADAAINITFADPDNDGNIVITKGGS